MLLHLNAFVLVQYIQAYKEDNHEYMLFFLPILFINIWGVIYALFCIVQKEKVSNASYFLSVGLAIIITLVIGLSFMFTLDFVIERFI